MAKQCVIRNAYDFVQYATAVVTNINIILIDAQHIKAQSSLLDQRWNGIRTIPNTLKIHYVKSLSFYNVEVRPFSKSNEKKTLLKTIKKNILFFNISHSKQAFFYFCLKKFSCFVFTFHGIL